MNPGSSQSSSPNIVHHPTSGPNKDIPRFTLPDIPRFSSFSTKVNRGSPTLRLYSTVPSDDPLSTAMISMPG